MLDRLLMIIPSRGRGERLNVCLAAVGATATRGRLDVLVLIDEDDTLSYSVIQRSGSTSFATLPGPQRLMVPKLNWAVEQGLTDGYAAVGFMGDDHCPRTPGWDVALLDAVTSGEGLGVAYGNDLLQGENMPTAVVLDGRIVDALGFMAPPTLGHLFCDNYWRTLGERLGTLTYLPDVVIEHVHYLTGAVEKDVTYLIGNNQERWVHDERAWRSWEAHQLREDLARIRENGSKDITVLVTTDGRTDLLDRTIASFEANVDGQFAQLLIHDDSGDPAVRNSIRVHLPEWGLITTPGRSGFAGARRHAWAHLQRHCQSPWVFMLEDDFVFNRPVDLNHLIAVMRAHPRLSQMAFRRQGWNGPEIEAGGVVELRPSDFEDHTDLMWDLDQPVAGTDTMTLARREHWLEHRLFWTSNPSLFRLGLVQVHDWPPGDRSEAEFCNRILTEHPEWTAGYWGPRSSTPWVHHIGDERHPMAWGY